ncbi:hypothetical protein KFL_001050150 [Klebsormidium nitens]|uniref:Zinc finger AN1 and C2H2 domain-containing stress-associated protein 16 n=1 Tax=Klebsormidium nitens TaxID=105231 RepID=A0A1Y1HZ95_KLENI|nr:hypothetical protein KFL_001050150 [Klebsormidium nitens]|eukprot:GAQ82251.1 hypothetical protein KFL_001050150 [Klebsormidium nitens]
MGTLLIPDLGEHCSRADCGQVDFLPFKCDGCSKVFCLEHRLYGAHSCPKAGAGDASVLLCPICAKAVRIIPGEDSNVTWDRHASSAGCDPANYAKAKRKPRCPVVGCREQLTFSNKVQCKECQQVVCLRHRFGPEHLCPGKPTAAKTATAYGKKFLQSFNNTFGTSAAASAASSSKPNSSKSGSNSKPAANPKRVPPKQAAAIPSSPQNTVQGSAFRRMQGAGVAERSSNGSTGAEECPVCHFRCDNVNELIAHSEAVHSQSGQPAGPDICPKCQRAFPDPVTLIRHVETEHFGNSREQSSSSGLAGFFKRTLDSLKQL